MVTNKCRIFPTESMIQSGYLTWLKLQHPIVFNVCASFANGGHREARYGQRLKREGLKKGFPDLGIFFPKGKYHGLFIEFKSANGIMRKEQKEVMSRLSSQEYKCIVCRSINDAIKETDNYLSCE